MVRKVWEGRANLAELEADGASGHIEALSLRLYTYKWWNWHDNYDAEPTPHPKWVDIITDPQGAAIRRREEEAKAS